MLAYQRLCECARYKSAVGVMLSTVLDSHAAAAAAVCRKHNLKVREHSILGPYVDGLSTLAVSSFEVCHFNSHCTPQTECSDNMFHYLLSLF